MLWVKYMHTVRSWVFKRHKKDLQPSWILKKLSKSLNISLLNNDTRALWFSSSLRKCKGWTQWIAEQRQWHQPAPSPHLTHCSHLLSIWEWRSLTMTCSCPMVMSRRSVGFKLLFIKHSLMWGMCGSWRYKREEKKREQSCKDTEHKTQFPLRRPTLIHPLQFRSCACLKDFLGCGLLHYLLLACYCDHNATPLASKALWLEYQLWESKSIIKAQMNVNDVDKINAKATSY